MNLNDIAQISGQNGVSSNKTADFMASGISEYKRSQESAVSRTVSGASVSFGTNPNFLTAYSEKNKGQSGLLNTGTSEKDLANEKNFETLVANGVTTKDRSLAEDDGYHLEQEDEQATVTIMDKIKAVLATSGVEIQGFTDDLDMEQLTQITGSRGYASAIEQAFSANDLPVNEENVAEVLKAGEMMDSLSSITEDMKGYMVENSLQPTIRNLYLAAHSTNGLLENGNGFYAQDAKGYFAKSAQGQNLTGLQPQIDQILESAGISAEEESGQKQARELIEAGIPLTKESLQLAMDIDKVELPVSKEELAGASAAAIADGKGAVNGNLADPRSNLTKAVELTKQVKEISQEALAQVVEQGRFTNLKALVDAQASLQNGTYETGISEDASTSVELLEARTQLEEVRLSMSVEVNLRMLRNGIQIETEPITQLIQDLKQAKQEMANALFPEQDKAAHETETGLQSAMQKSDLYQEAMGKIRFLPDIPAAAVAAMKDSFRGETLDQIYEKGTTLALEYEAAGEEYEKLMTSPRADMGDRIEKAFRNVDSLLEEAGQELTAENRRAVRILGYNKMEISQENLEEVKAADAQLTSVISALKPGAVLQLIRDGENPLQMTLSQLQQKLEENNTGAEASDEKFSKFLYKLEQKNEITEQERSSYIGIYRLFHTIEKTHGAAIGTVLETGQEMTLGNLLTATRVQKAGRAGVDYRIDDTFGGISAGDTTGFIDEQISSAFTYYKAKADTIYANLDPEKLQAAGPTSETTLPELADALEQTERDPVLEQEWLQHQAAEQRETVTGEMVSEAREELMQHGLFISLNQMGAMEALQNGRRFGKENLWESYDELMRTTGDNPVEDLQEELGSSEDYAKEYGEKLQDMAEALEGLTEEGEISFLDIQAITLMHKQIRVAGRAAEAGSFDIPVETENGRISMHVELQSANQTGSGVEISMDTREHGEIRASLQLRDGRLTGMISTDREKSSLDGDYLENLRTRFAEQIDEENTGIDQDASGISVLYGRQGNGTAGEADLPEQSQRQVLFSLAKSFVMAINE